MIAAGADVPIAAGLDRPALDAAGRPASAFGDAAGQVCAGGSDERAPCHGAGLEGLPGGRERTAAARCVASPIGRRRDEPRAIVTRLLVARAVIVDVIELVCVARPCGPDERDYLGQTDQRGGSGCPS
ncbi:hypothetical protein GCM10009687_69170 [Asanoa iriomotensis]|uniref:Uncharacterized protein n=1 Tax=Asanoa iriomotensis TaxID=234613 RepID=A0ABQ4C9J9_9ACTN|nr:hypothetical protein Air01nite_55430 [Asanoa iriomotensis]